MLTSLADGDIYLPSSGSSGSEAQERDPVEVRKPRDSMRQGPWCPGLDEASPARAQTSAPPPLPSGHSGAAFARHSTKYTPGLCFYALSSRNQQSRPRHRLSWRTKMCEQSPWHSRVGQANYSRLYACFRLQAQLNMSEGAGQFVLAFVVERWPELFTTAAASPKESRTRSGSRWSAGRVW